MWQADHRRFMPGLLKAIITLALQLYLFTGARIGAFIPENEDRHERGLRYKVKFIRSWDCLSLIYIQAHCSRIVSFRYDTLEARLESRPSMAQRQSEPRLHSVGHLTNLLSMEFLDLGLTYWGLSVSESVYVTLRDHNLQLVIFF